MREASDSAWAKISKGMPASLWTDTVTSGSGVTGTLDQAVEHRTIEMATDQRNLRNVFSNMALASEVEARIS
jgi:hypothetical protein